MSFVYTNFKKSGYYLIVATNYTHGVEVLRKHRDSEVFFNSKTKVYPNGHYKRSLCNKPIYKKNGFEEEEREDLFKDLARVSEHGELPNLLPKNVNFETGEIIEKVPRDRTREILRRAREQIFDITMCNDFDYFVTWTFSPEVVDRSDFQAIYKKLGKWLNNMVERKNMTYIIIPEFHKDKKNIHFHGLIKGDLTYIPCVSPKSGKPLIHKNTNTQIMSIREFKMGFNSAIQLHGEKLHVAKYITKYITKNSERVGKRYYFSSRDLKRIPDMFFYNHSTLDFLSFDSKEYTIPNTDLKFKYFNSWNNIKK